jgi:hypothetical protein
MKRLCGALALFFLIIGIFSYHPERARTASVTCNPQGNPTGAWLQSYGTYTIGDILLFGPGCNQVQDGGPINTGTYQIVSSGPFTFTTAQCNVEVIFEGNTYFTASIGSAASFGTCNLRLRNGDIYTGSGSGRGRQISLNGFGTFNLYPGQMLNLQSDGTNWNPSVPLRNDGLGFPWQATGSVQLYVNVVSGNNNNDGLDSSAPFPSLARCAAVAYQIVYTKNYGSVICSAPATQSLTEFVQVFYPINGGGTLIFNSQTPGSQFTWNCPANQGCLQFGDGALVGLTDISFQPAASSSDIISGHNHGVLDANTNLKFTMANGTRGVFSGDFDAHFNINNGFNYVGTGNFLFGGTTTNTSGLCQGCKWNINGAINSVGTTTLSRQFIFGAGQDAVFQGNVSWGTTGLSTSVGLVQGNSVLNNFAGAPPGGAPTPTTGGQYCTTAC